MSAQITFDQFCHNLGFKDYPFSTFNAENEKRNSRELFVQPQNHSILLQCLRDKNSVLIIGERGTGKTALSYEMKRVIDQTKNLLVYIDDYSWLELNFSQNAYYRFLTQHIASVFFLEMTNHRSVFWRYSKEERIELSFFLSEYVNPSSKKALHEKISSIQNSIFKRCAIGLYNKIRGILNYGLHALTYAANDIITKHFSALPPPNANVPEYFAKLSVETDTSFEKHNREFQYLSRLTQLIKKSTFNDITLIIDKIDEDSRLENDAENISEFLSVIASDNKTLLHENFNIVLFMWSVPYNFLKGNIRTQKLSVQKLGWTNPDLIKALNNRLLVYSDNSIPTVDSILDAQAKLQFNKILDTSNENPRDLWHIMDKAVQQTFKLHPNATQISADAIDPGIDEFVRSFNYYEYYPKKSNSRANSMDVYSYIKHLSKLSKTIFTKDQLNTEAGTGSSTSNYVVAMENMGLIIRSETKAANNAMLYRIKDPKVLYALANSIEIERGAI